VSQRTNLPMIWRVWRREQSRDRAATQQVRRLQAALDRWASEIPTASHTQSPFGACPTCHAINVVRTDDFSYVVCRNDLPYECNLDQI
jgi:hypothetical protein